jgi:hypothetical protein
MEVFPQTKMHHYSLREKIHRGIYLILLMACVVTLPLSEYVLSMAEIFLAANFLAEGKYKEKFNRIKSDKFALLNLSLFFMLIIGLLYTSDYAYAMKDIRIKLPLLFFPVIFATTRKLSKKELGLILLTFILAVALTAIINIFIAKDIRGMSYFVSHIRFGLLVCLAIFACIYFLKSFRLFKSYLGIPFYLLIAFFVSFLLYSSNFTGIIILAITAVFFILRFLFTQNPLWIKVLSFIVLLAIAFFFIQPIVKNYKILYSDSSPRSFSALEQETKEGNLYFHDTTNLIRENEYYIRQYLCEEELEREWNKRSQYDYHTQDSATAFSKEILIRYMTSKNLKKDAEGMAQMTDKDILAVEKGISNYRFLTMNPYEKRTYKILWEIQEYQFIGNPNGHSVIQRYIYLQIAWKIIKENWLIGVGTGDLLLAYDEIYAKTDTALQDGFKHRAHNQYFTMWLSFGILGFLLFIFVLIYPLIYQKNNLSFLYLAFFCIIVLSMLTEDTLETQTGVSIFAFFNSFLFYNTTKTRKEDGIKK